MFNQINKKIVEVFGINTLSEGKQREAMQKIGPLVCQEVLVKAMEIMNEEDRSAFEKLVEENNNPEEMFVYLAEKVPTIYDIASQEIEKLKAENGDLLEEL